VDEAETSLQRAVEAGLRSMFELEEEYIDKVVMLSNLSGIRIDILCNLMLRFAVASYESVSQEGMEGWRKILAQGEGLTEG
jgi:hypothetical protein